MCPKDNFKPYMNEHKFALPFANVEADFDNTTPRVGIQGYCCIQISQRFVWVSYLLFVLHSKPHIITPIATKVHVILRNLVVLTWIRERNVTVKSEIWTLNIRSPWFQDIRNMEFGITEFRVYMAHWNWWKSWDEDVDLTKTMKAGIQNTSALAMPPIKSHKVGENHEFRSSMNGKEPSTSYRWIDWVWKTASGQSRLQEKYPSF